MEQELARLARVLRQIAHDAGCALLYKADPKSVQFCVAQYNNIIARLGELDETVGTIFSPLEEDVTFGQVRMAARSVASYLKDSLRQKQERRPSFVECLDLFLPGCFFVNLDRC